MRCAGPIAAGSCLALLVLLVLAGCQGHLTPPRGPAGAPGRFWEAASQEPSDARSVLAAYIHAGGTDALLVAGEPAHAPVRRGPGVDRGRRGGWAFVVGLYGWLANTDGDVWADGEAEPIDVPFDQVTENVDFGIQAYFEARYRRLFLAVDLTDSEIRADFTVLRTQVGVGVDQTILEVKGGYRVLGPEFGVGRCDPCACPPRCPAVDLFAGVRYWRTDTALDRVTPPLGPLPASRARFTDVEDWADLIFGVRYTQPIGQRVSVILRGDYGGFGIGDSAQSTWQLTGAVGWTFARRWSVLFGWRVMNVNHATGSGAGKNGSDTTQSGPLFSIAYEF